MLHYRRIGSARLYNYLYRTIPLTIGVFTYVTAWVILLNHSSRSWRTSRSSSRIWADPGGYARWARRSCAYRPLAGTGGGRRCTTGNGLWYCLLSTTSKMILGLLLATNVIYLGDFDGALSFLNTTAVNVTALAPVV